MAKLIPKDLGNESLAEENTQDIFAKVVGRGTRIEFGAKKVEKRETSERTLSIEKDVGSELILPTTFCKILGAAIQKRVGRMTLLRILSKNYFRESVCIAERKKFE